MDTQIFEWIRDKFKVLSGDLDERGRRRWAATEANALGHGGISLVAAATGMSDRTIRTGIAEISSSGQLRSDRQRRVGGGRKSNEAKDPELVRTLEALVEPSTRGDPESPLRWTCKSVRTLSVELQRQGHIASSSKVGSLLRGLGYSLQSNRKTLEGTHHPDRNAQFEFISRRTKAQQRTGQPTISVDTKKKETLGNLKNGGRMWRPTGQPLKVKTHDFPDTSKGKAVPYGVYDLGNNEAWVSVGVSHDTAEFAVASIRLWWKKLGRKRYASPRRLQIVADSGGSNGSRNRLWKAELQKLANQLNVPIEVNHFPPGTSKWNKIEHRLFCHITRNWRGVPLETHQMVVDLIGSTRTTQGLEVHASLDQKSYTKGRTVNASEFANINLKPDTFHGEWNYTILPTNTR